MKREMKGRERGGKVVGQGEEEGRGGKEREGKGLLSFHFIFQKPWVEPGNPSYNIR